MTKGTYRRAYWGLTVSECETMSILVGRVAADGRHDAGAVVTSLQLSHLSSSEILIFKKERKRGWRRGEERRGERKETRQRWCKPLMPLSSTRKV